MKSIFDAPLTRRAWMVFTGLTAAGCGGGGSTFASPGTGGTGAVYAQGSISGFGSVIVNGIKFDDLKATVTLDGAAATSADLRLGMVAEIQGQRDTDLTLGTASSIEVWTLAQGVVSALIGGGFVVSGMRLVCDAATVFDGFNNLGEVTVDQTVAVWGLQNLADASQWKATRVALVGSGAAVVSSGLVQLAGGAVLLNGLFLKGSAVANLTQGALVRVEGALTEPGELQVSTVRSLDLPVTNLSGSSVELEAYVTEMQSLTRFKLGLVEVDASAADMQQAASLAVGNRVEVYGYWRSGVLLATRVSTESEDETQQSEISGTVSAFNSVADFVVRNQRCDATSASFSHGVAADLKRDVWVKLEGVKSGAVLQVTSVEFDH